MAARLFIFCVALLSVSAMAIFVYIRKVNLIERARTWPLTEATIQTAAVEAIPNGRYTVDLPTFGFSYVIDGEYYSGRFALLEHGDRADELVKKLANQKLSVHYDPKHPEIHFIPNNTIEGCEIEQKINDMPFSLNPEA